MKHTNLQPAFQQPFTETLYNQLKAICQSVTNSDIDQEQQNVNANYESLLF